MSLQGQVSLVTGASLGIGRGGNAVFVAADVSRADDVRALVEQAVARFGGLDVACNNAGIRGDLAR